MCECKYIMETSFFKWVFTRWYFYVVFILWGVWSGLEELRAAYIVEFLATLVTSFGLTLVIFLIVFSIKKFISKKVKEEVNAK